MIVARNFFLPLLFRLAELMEQFHPRTALKMMLVRYTFQYTAGVCVYQLASMHTCRMFVLYFSSLYVLVIALFTLSDNCGVCVSTLMLGSCCSVLRILPVPRTPLTVVGRLQLGKNCTNSRSLISWQISPALFYWMQVVGSSAKSTVGTVPSLIHSTINGLV